MARKRPEAKEQIAGRQITKTPTGISVNTEWFVFNTTDPTIALRLLPDIGDRFSLKGQKLDSWVDNIELQETENVSPVTLSATVSYGEVDPSDNENIATWSLSTQAQRVNVQEAFSQRNLPTGLFEKVVFDKTPQDILIDPEKEATGGVALPPTKKEIIEFLTIRQGDEGVSGVDVFRPASTLRIVHQKKQVEEETAKYLAVIAKASGTVNAKPLKGPWGEWKIGEALYLGAEISAPNLKVIEISHSFIRSENAAVRLNHLDQFGKDFKSTEAEKSGWEFVWFRRGLKPGKEVDKNRPLPVNITAHIAVVYKSSDFNTKLQIPILKVAEIT